MALAMTDRKKPGVAFWATVVVVVALVAGYPLSYGLILSLHHRWPEWNRLPESAVHRAVSIVYYPLNFIICEGPCCLVDPYLEYLDCWSDHVDGYRLIRRGAHP